MLLGIQLVLSVFLSFLLDYALSFNKLKKYTSMKLPGTWPVILAGIMVIGGIFVLLYLQTRKIPVGVEMVGGVVVGAAAMGATLGTLGTRVDGSDNEADPQSFREGGIRGGGGCGDAVMTALQAPTRSSKEKYLAARKACELHVCDSEDCCPQVLQLDEHSTSKVYGSLLERDCMMLLSEKCRGDRISYTNKIMNYLSTLGDGAPCPVTTCAPNQMTIADMADPIKADDSSNDKIVKNQRKLKFPESFDEEWYIVGGECTTSANGQENCLSGCEYCDTLGIFKMHGPVNQMRHWVKNLLLRASSLSPVCTTCVKTVKDLKTCLRDKSPESIFSADPLLLSDVKYVLEYLSDADNLDMRPQCYEADPADGCLNVRLSKFENFMNRCTTVNERAMCK